MNRANPTALLRRDASLSAFTLIELLMVIAVIGILVGMSVGIIGSVQSAKARAQAKAQIESIAQGIDLFKARYGDYPWAAGNPGTVEENGERLFLSLMGYMEFTGSGPLVSFVQKDEDSISTVEGPRSFVDPTTILKNQELPDPFDPTVAPTGYHFLDPWGNPYVYRYREASSSTWDNFSYLLYSVGPDGLDTAVDPDGILTDSIVNDTQNADNIYYGS